MSDLAISVDRAGLGRVFLDGADISKQVRSLEIKIVAGEPPDVRVELGFRNLHADIEGTVRVHQELRPDEVTPDTVTSSSGTPEP